MSIRSFFLALISVLSLLLAVIGFWQIQDQEAKAEAVEWLQQSNHLMSSIQRASAELANERGLTTSLLAEKQSPRPDAAKVHHLWLKVQAQQDISNQRLAEVQYWFDGMLALRSNHPLAQYQARFDLLQEYLATRRQAVAVVVQTGRPALDVAHWIADSTQIIDTLYSMAGVGMLPLDGNVYSYASRSVVQDVLFTLSEYLGRERALLVAALVKQQPLTPDELARLAEYHSVAKQALQRVEGFLGQLDEGLYLQNERQALRQYVQQFEAQRLSLIQASQDLKAYPITGEEWFDTASQAINQVILLSQELEKRFDAQIAALKTSAEQARYLMTVVLCAFVCCFVLAVYLLRARVLQPLMCLAQTAQQIGAGNLQQAVRCTRNDEVGRLGQALEQMRLQLLADIEAQKLSAKEFKKLHTAMSQSVAAMLITDAQGTVEYVNPTFCTNTGYSEAEILGRKAGFWRSDGTQTHKYQELWQTIQEGRVWLGELLNQRKNGELFWALVSVSPVLDESGEITHFIDMHMDISEHKRLAQRLDFISYYDQTTGLPNRQYLAREFTKLAQDERAGAGEVQLISLSIGRLKHINDSLGWQVGDNVLQEVARRLKVEAQSMATVAHQEGGKFMLLAPSVQVDIQAYTQKLIDSLSQPVFIGHHQLQLIPKAGIANTRLDQGDFDVLLKHANIALHYAEQAALEGLFVYSSNMNASTQRRLSLEGALRQAIKNNELELYYQPKIDTRTAQVVAVEALARWQNRATGEYIAPDVFIPLAEDTGLIFALGEWVFNEACRQAKDFAAQGLPSITIAVNISVEQLKQPDFAQKLAQSLKRHGISAQYLELEITESLFMENPEQALAILADLKSMGFKLAIDDFGTGYSSLSYLSRLPVDYLKIDRSFVEQVTSDIRAAAIATSIIALGHRMGLKVIAEGIETEAQRAYLMQHQCDEMQGYFFSRPLPALKLAEFLLTHNEHGSLPKMARTLRQ
jgi:PAS domain S-box-containing protein/diguanylate cyclase (GGDEF)-like protein